MNQQSSDVIEGTLYKADSRTKIRLLSSLEQDSVVPYQLPSNKRISDSFGGYAPQVEQALAFVKLGLGVGGTSFDIPAAGPLSFKLPRGLLLFGSPGTGKTLLMRLIVRHLGCFSVDLSYTLLANR